MTKEDLLRGMMVAHSGSLRSFAKKVGLPYSTITGLMSRGIDTATAQTLSKICDELGITVNDLLAGNMATSISPASAQQLRLQEIMEEKGLTYIDVAQKCNIPAATIRGMLESGSGDISVEYLRRLAQGLNVTANELIGIENHKADNMSAIERRQCSLKEAFTAYGLGSIPLTPSDADRCMQILALVFRK